VIQKRIVKAGLAKQAVKGTPIAAATYAFGVTEGSVFKQEITEAELGLTWGNRSVQGFDRSEMKPKQSMGLVATPNVIGLLLLGVFGTDVVTGAGPYVHTLTTAPDLPYLTGFGTFGIADWGRIVDCKVSSLELIWAGAGKVIAKVELMGITPSMLGAVYTETNQELIATVGFLAGAGGLFNVEGAAAAVQSGTIKFDNKAVQPGLANTVLPGDVVPAEFEVTYSLKILPSDTKLFREVVFGSGAAGALPTAAISPYLGAIECKFLGPAGSSLDITSTAVKFATEFPEGAAAGGPAEITLAGIASTPAGSPEATAVLTNSVATY
jgi:hypothetical protein